MRQNTHKPSAGSPDPAAELLVAVGLVAGVAVLLLALSYPVVLATMTSGAVAAVVAESALRRVTTTGVCIPGTDVCIRPTA